MNEYNQPLYLKIYNYVLDCIKTGQIAVGEKISSEKELADQFNVSRITSKKALEMLAEDGMIKRIPGKGSFVISKEDNSNKSLDKDERENHNYTMIGLVFSDFSESYGSELHAGIEEEASKNGCYIVSRRSCGKQDKEEEAIDALIEMGIDGMIIMPVQCEHYNHKIIRLILDGYPIVLMDRYLKGLSASFVGTDNVEAARKATDYLLKLGHRRISLLAPHYIDTSTIEDRIEGFVKSHAENGVVVDESIWQTDLTSTLPGNQNNANIESDMNKIRELISNNKDITCFFAIEYRIALLVTEVLKSMNLRVPEDISVLCFDGPLNYLGQYFYTHIRQHEKQMGIKSVKLLLEQIEGINKIQKEFLSSDLIIGNSTASVR